MWVGLQPDYGAQVAAGAGVGLKVDRRARGKSSESERMPNRAFSGESTCPTRWLLFGVITLALFTKALILIGLLALAFKRFHPSHAHPREA